ncbi:hypothetical protein ACQQ9Y_07540 [Atopobiaceae bacterium SGI.236]
MFEPTIVYTLHELIQETIRKVLVESLPEDERPERIEYDVCPGDPMLDASTVDIIANFSTPKADYTLSFSLVTIDWTRCCFKNGQFEIPDAQSRTSVEGVELSRVPHDPHTA